jgi:hypothetical protein
VRLARLAVEQYEPGDGLRDHAEQRQPISTRAVGAAFAITRRAERLSAANPLSPASITSGAANAKRKPSTMPGNTRRNRPTSTIAMASTEV